MTSDDVPLRFTDIRRAIPDLSDRLLAERLRGLQAQGLVEPAAAPGAPGYRPTGKARALEPALGELERWAHDWLEP